MSSRISNSRKIPGPKKRELGGNTVVLEIMHCTISWMCARSTNYNTQIIAEKVKVGT